MSVQKQKEAALVQIKLNLADKYDRLARRTSSDPKRKTFTYKADRYRRQATELSRTD